MKVEALCSINSGAIRAGEVFDVPQSEGEALLRAGAVRVVPQKPDTVAVNIKGKTGDKP